MTAMSREGAYVFVVGGATISGPPEVSQVIAVTGGSMHLPVGLGRLEPSR